MNLQVMGSAKHNDCSLELLSLKDLTHILDVEKGKGPQNPIRIAKEYQLFFARTD